MTANQQSPGTLYIVATPIGNLEDISLRAQRILSEVSLIACEDTRHTKKLLNHLGLKTPLTSYYREREKAKAQQLMGRLQAGKDLALVSDAGTPALSDPGSVLVSLARQAGVQVVPVPGPSALTAALSASGLADRGFFFGGFPPPKRSARRTFFKELARLPYPLIFYESPHRIKSCLQDCCTVFGERQGMLFKELTKIHEQCFVGTLNELLDRVSEGIRGELVLVVLGHQKRHEDKPDNLEELLSWYRQQPDMSLKDAVKCIAEDLNLPRNLVYQQALAVWKSDR